MRKSNMVIIRCRGINMKLLSLVSIIVILIILLCAGCQTKTSKMSEKMIKVIDNQLSQNNDCKISIESITDFKWDKMVIFQVGSSNDEITKALGVKYNGRTDLTSGMVFVLNKKVVHEERVPYDPEHQNIIQYIIEKKPNEPSCVSFTPSNALFKGSREEIDGVFYYTITAKK